MGGDQAGVDIPDGATYQYLDLKHKNALIPVDQAIHTPGALLFYFSKMPQDGSGRPPVAHVAISLGDGKTIEEGHAYGSTSSRQRTGSMLPASSQVSPTNPLRRVGRSRTS